jgi:tetratricopeptide (TPR) repeat protein
MQTVRALLLFILIGLLAACGSGDSAHITKGQEAANQGNTAEAISEYTLAIDGDITPEQRFQARLARAKVYASSGETDKAQADLDAAVAMTEGEKPVGDKTAALSQRAEFWVNQKKWEEAVKDLDQVITAQPQNYQALARRGYAHLQLRNFEQAIADLKASLQGDIQAATADVDSESNLVSAYHDLGQAMLNAGQYDDALNAYNEALAIVKDDDDKAQVLASRGFAYQQQGDADKALADLNEAIQLDDQLAIAYAYRSGIYSDAEQYEDAIADATKAVDLGKDLSEKTRSALLHARALAYLAIGEYEKTIEDATESISLEGPDSPNAARTYDIRGDAYRQLEDYENAIADATKAIELGAADLPALAGFYSSRALSYYYMEDYEAALADQQAAIEVSGGPTASLLERLADIQFAMGQQEEAIASYQQAIELSPDDPWLHYYLGGLYAEMENLEEAEAEYRAALELGDEASFHERLGSTLRQQERYDEAIQSYTIALEKEADRPNSLLGRGLAYYSLGDYANARTDLEQSLTFELDAETAQFVQEILDSIP